MTRDGTRTVYLGNTLSASAGMQALNPGPDLVGGDLGGEVEVVVAATFGPDGELREVSASAVAGGEASSFVSSMFGSDAQAGGSGEVVYQATLPIRDAADRQVTQDFLTATGMSQIGPMALSPRSAAYMAGSLVRFVDSAMDRGYTTRQTFRTEDTTDAAFDAEAKLGVEFGVSGSLESARRWSTGADYWDGRTWVARRECASG